MTNETDFRNGIIYDALNVKNTIAEACSSETELFEKLLECDIETMHRGPNRGLI